MLIHSKHSGYARDGRRLYFKGGGDPGADARAQEAERQARITAATDKINSIFGNTVPKTREVAGGSINLMGSNFAMPNTTETYYDNGDPANSRDVLYNEQRQAVYDINKLEVDRQATEAARQNRFGLARTGLAGGSVDVDSNEDINRRTNEGLLRAGGIADQSAADLKTADESTRASLISMAQSGIDTGSAATMALNGLKANADSVAGQRSGASVGSLFGDMSQAYLANQQRQGTAAGSQLPGQQWYGVSSPNQTYTGK